ncbi:Band 4.1-like protein [Echinococcus granulosus]|uniref:Band 4.1-like protein n=1 Tax=Echinococcus granulosus TaxID=6210 RepID=W6UW35_ECHGR|nr:Band 4.1-like protein [Echinococcus granulosus]EUB62652.1 Band 4.1-like protein [Echinococcus granulosus]
MFQSKATLPDGTIEITDTLPKQDYYKSLRRNSVSSPGSQFTINNSTNVYDATSGYRKSKAIEYKPSGKQVQCSVLMLEGIEQIYTIDNDCAVCERCPLRLHELFRQHRLKRGRAVPPPSRCCNTAHAHIYEGGSRELSCDLVSLSLLAGAASKKNWEADHSPRVSAPLSITFYLRAGTQMCGGFLCLHCSRRHSNHLCASRYVPMYTQQIVKRNLLPCSFNTYVILGAYVIQSEAGDWDSEVHEGIEYLYNVPFAPKNLQTPEMLIRIAELHQKLKGRTPEQADRMFLENARRMALYGSVTGDDLSLGVYHAGVLVYRGRLRMQRYTWARIVELSYRGKDFIMVVRPVIFDEYIESPSGGARRRTSVSSIKGSLSGNEISSIERGTAKQRSRSAKPASVAQRNKTLTFKCLNGELAKRLYNVVIDHHTFFRLREGGNSRRLNLQPGFGTRKYHYNSRPQIFEDNESGVWTLNRDGGLPPTGSIRRVAAQRRPEQYEGTGFRAPCASIEDADSIRNGYQGGANTIGPHESSVLMEESYAPVKSSHPAPGSSVKAPADWTLSSERPPQQFRQMARPPNVTPRMPRPELSRQHWQMSPADCTQGLGMDFYGTDVATMMDAGWQGSRTNRGIKGPGAYYYEVSVLEDGDVRVGWSTNDASLMLGMDSHGYGYGAAENGEGSSVKQSAMGRLVHNGKVHEMGFPASVSDVIGCFLQLQKNPNGDGLEGNVMWSHNGQLVTSPHANIVCIPPEIATDSAFFPSK